MPDIFDEVTQDLKKENFAALAKRYGKTLSIACFFSVLVVSIYVGWQASRRATEGKAVTAYIDATNILASGDANHGIAGLLELAKNAPHPVREMAGLRAGAYLLQIGKKPEALDIYQKISDSGSDETFRSLATVILAKNTIGNKDDENKYDVKIRLQTAAKADSPVSASAKEMLALIAIEDGDVESARKNLMLISTNPLAPAPLRKRAGDLLASYEK